jgi:hypothetical protein
MPDTWMSDVFQPGCSHFRLPHFFVFEFGVCLVCSMGVTIHCSAWLDEGVFMVLAMSGVGHAFLARNGEGEDDTKENLVYGFSS